MCHLHNKGDSISLNSAMETAFYLRYSSTLHALGAIVLIIITKHNM